MDEFEHIKIWPDEAAFAEFVTRRIVNMIHATLQVNEVFHLLLSGGSTPYPIYEKLGIEYGEHLPWEKIHLWFGDERAVAPDHQDSNYRMVQEALLSHIQIPPENVHRIRGEDDPQEAAASYQREIEAAFVGHEQLFDLALLGMGDDGHTASLFPGTDAIHEGEKWVIAHHVEAKGNLWRISLTFPAILQSANIMFLIRGANKADPLKQVLYGDFEPNTYPTQVIARSHHQHITYVLDREAGALLHV